MKKILVIHYSQSGQLTEILHNFTRSFQTDDVDFVAIKPSRAYTFPWTSASFYKEMPSSVILVRNNMIAKVPIIIFELNQRAT